MFPDFNMFDIEMRVNTCERCESNWANLQANREETKTLFLEAC